MKHIRPHSFGPHSPLSSRLPHVDPLACRDLWSAVLLGVLRDLCAPQPRSLARDAAETWVGDWPRRDFRTVCHLAGIEPDWLHGALFSLVSRPVEERRRHLATLLGCQPGQVGLRLMMRQTAVEDRQESTGDAERDTEQGTEQGTEQALTPAPVPIGPEARREQIAAMFDQGTTPSDMPQAFATEGHAVPMAQVWNDIRHLRATGRIGYLREPHAPQHTATSGAVT